MTKTPCYSCFELRSVDELGECLACGTQICGIGNCRAVCLCSLAVNLPEVLPYAPTTEELLQNDNGGFAVDLVNHEMYWTEQLRTLTVAKLERSQITINQYHACVHPQDLTRAVESFNAATENHQGEWEGIYRLLMDSGEALPVICKGQLRYDEHGRALAYVGRHLPASSIWSTFRSLQTSPTT